MNGLVFKNGRWVMLCGPREYPLDYRDPSGQIIKVAEPPTLQIEDSASQQNLQRSKSCQTQS